MAGPLAQLGELDGEGAAAGVLPGEAVGEVEDQDVGDVAVLIALQAHAFAAAHLRHLVEREHQQPAVVADHRNLVAGGGADDRGHGRLVDVEHLAALAGAADHVVLVDHEAAAVGGGHDHLGAGPVGQHGDDVLALAEVGHDADRLALATAAGQLRSVERERAAVGREHQDAARRLGEEARLERVVALERQAGEVGDVAL